MELHSTLPSLPEETPQFGIFPNSQSQAAWRKMSFLLAAPGYANYASSFGSVLWDRSWPSRSTLEAQGMQWSAENLNIESMLSTHLALGRVTVFLRTELFWLRGGPEAGKINLISNLFQCNWSYSCANLGYCNFLTGISISHKRILLLMLLLNLGEQRLGLPILPSCWHLHDIEICIGA